PLRGLGCDAIEFRRGLAEAVHISAKDFIRHGNRLFALAPLRRVRILESSINEELVRELASSPHLGHLSGLQLSAHRIGTAGASALASSPHLRNLTTLDLSGNDIGDEGARVLAASPSLSNLRKLDLGGNGIGDEGAAAMATSVHLHRQNLENLDLTRNHI